jgi:CRP-like cAMP-binding protein
MMVKYRAGEMVFKEGQPSRSVLIIDVGNVKVTRTATDGAEVTMAIRGPGYIMGDEGVLMDEPRSATVTAMTHVAGVDVPANALIDFVDQHQLWRMMYQAAVLRRRQSEEDVILDRKDVRGRLVSWLLQLADKVGEPVDDGLEIASTQSELAGRIGASRDAVAIELRRLRDDGLVTTGRGHIVVHDREALRLSTG